MIHSYEPKSVSLGTVVVGFLLFLVFAALGLVGPTLAFAVQCIRVVIAVLGGVA